MKAGDAIRFRSHKTANCELCIPKQKSSSPASRQRRSPLLLAPVIFSSDAPTFVAWPTAIPAERGGPFLATNNCPKSWRFINDQNIQKSKEVKGGGRKAAWNDARYSVSHPSRNLARQNRFSQSTDRSCFRARPLRRSFLVHSANFEPGSRTRIDQDHMQPRDLAFGNEKPNLSRLRFARRRVSANVLLLQYSSLRSSSAC